MIGRLRIAILDALDEHLGGLLVGGLVILYVGQGFARDTSMGAGDRGALDFALWWVWLASGLVALVLGSRATSVPLTTGSARFLLVGPLSPGRWALERLAGAALVAVGYATVLCTALLPLGMAHVGFTVFLLAEVVLLVAAGGFAGTLLAPLPALLLAGALWWIGTLAAPWAAVMVDLGHPWARQVLPFLPDLDTLEAHQAAVRGRPLSTARIGRGVAWSSAWTTAVGAATVWLSSNRDL